MVCLLLYDMWAVVWYVGCFMIFWAVVYYVWFDMWAFVLYVGFFVICGMLYGMWAVV